MRTWKRQSHGFTLIELLVVVLIIGILAALAIPRFFSTSVRAKQSEAKQILKQIYTEQRAYRQLYDAYIAPGPGVVANATNPNALAPISIQIMSTARYDYFITSSDGGMSDFLATAQAANPGLDEDATPDVMTIDNDGNILHVSNDAED